MKFEEGPLNYSLVARDTREILHNVKRLLQDDESEDIGVDTFKRILSSYMKDFESLNSPDLTQATVNREDEIREIYSSLENEDYDVEEVTDYIEDWCEDLEEYI